ncbi:C39 family peptidase [Alkalimarinus sediminis]|uniref:C39 family peptidase n=1 Tax=Alkalimarinus sediminis TaxID=1632866 RepID=A0A9E8KQH0_9ALTE|nr:C39 family peptidase [Alkalimarinus sediminis]UZW76448.1 C39 family peptidase [Alkalimarinus sediminis]
MILVLVGSVLAFTMVQEASVIEPHRKGLVIYERSINNESTFIQERVVVEPLSELRFRNITRQAYDYSCGSAALTTVLEFYLGRKFQERQVMEGLLHYGESERIVERRGFSMLDMKRLVTALGYPAGGFKAEIEDLIELDHPAIVPINHAGFKHFVVVRTIKDGRVYIADPSQGNITFTIELFKEKWDQNVLFVVFPGNSKPIDGLELREEDLRYIDDQTITYLAFQQFPDFNEPLENKIQNELERQKNNPDGSVDNTVKHLHYRRQ